jgi:hypothetical protein
MPPSWHWTAIAPPPPSAPTISSPPLQELLLAHQMEGPVERRFAAGHRNVMFVYARSSQTGLESVASIPVEVAN